MPNGQTARRRKAVFGSVSLRICNPFARRRKSHVLHATWHFSYTIFNVSYGASVMNDAVFFTNI